MKTCAACSMPFDDESFIGLHSNNNLFCIYCVDENKNIKSCEDIFEGDVNYFMNEENFTREYAEKIVRKNMTLLPFWKNNSSLCLSGEMLTDDEFNKLFIRK